MGRELTFQLEGAIKPEDEYAYYRYTGKKPIIVGEKRVLTLYEGDVFGARWATNRKLIRLVLQNAPTKVYTINLDTARALAKRVQLVRKWKNWSAT